MGSITVLPHTAHGADERRKLLDENPGMEIRKAGSCFVLMPITNDYMQRQITLDRFLMAEKMAAVANDRR